MVSTNEVGYATGDIATWSNLGPDIDEQNPDLMWPNNLKIYERMRTEESQVVSVLSAVILPIMSTGWSLDCTGVRDEVAQVISTDFDLPIKGKDPEPRAIRKRGRFSWNDHLRMSLLALPFGHSYFNQSYEIRDKLARLHKLAWRPHGTISKFNVASDGGLVSIEQHPKIGDAKPVTIKVGELVAYVHQREGGNWAGRSLLRPAYKNWLLKDRMMRSQALTVDRNGLGVPIYTAAPTPDGAESGDAEAWRKNEQTEGLKVATGFRSGENAGASLPNGSTFTLRGVEGDLPDSDKPIRYHDEQIARAVLAHFLNLGTQTGSWALGSTFADFFVDSLNAEAQWFADVTQQHAIDDLVDLNWGEDEPAPRLVFEKIGSQSPVTAEAIKALVDAGVLTADDKLEEYLRQALGLPVFENYGVERTRAAGSTTTPKESA